MAHRPRLFAPGLLYHVIVRGNQRQKTFTTNQDYRTYLNFLAKYRARFDVIIHAYCLMPNQVHLLVQSSAEPLAKFEPANKAVSSNYETASGRRKNGKGYQGDILLFWFVAVQQPLVVQAWRLSCFFVAFFRAPHGSFRSACGIPLQNAVNEVDPPATTFTFRKASCG